MSIQGGPQKQKHKFIHAYYLDNFQIHSIISYDFPFFFLSKYMDSLLIKQKRIKKNIKRSDMDQSQHENLTVGCPNSKCVFSKLF